MLQYKGYLGKVEFDEDAFHGEVVGIRDAVTFRGSSVDELRTAFQDSVDDYLDDCTQRGEEPDKTCSGKFVVRISPDLHRKVNMLATASGKSLNAFVSDCLGQEVGSRLPAE